MEDLPLQAAFKARNNPSDKIILTYEILRSPEDLLLTCLRNYEDQHRGFSVLRACKEIQNDCLIKTTDLLRNKRTEVLLNNVKGFDQGIKACQRQTAGTKIMKSVFGDPMYSIGDIRLQTIANIRNRKDLFSMLNINSVTDSASLGTVLYGVTEPTCQLSCGPSMLANHIEHHSFASVNIHHHGFVKEWEIIPASMYLKAIKKMELLQSELTLPPLTGACELCLTHRNIFFPLDLLDVGGTKFDQEPGDIVIVHPSAIHAIKNHGQNLAESRNVLPLEFKNQVASYKTCRHWGTFGGEPLQIEMDRLTEDLPITDFIHESDPHKEYKIKLLDQILKGGNQKKYEEAVSHIKQYHHVPEWFTDMVPLIEDVEKQNKCTYCEYATDCQYNLRKHIKNTHKKKKIPDNPNSMVSCLVESYVVNESSQDECHACLHCKESPIKSRLSHIKGREVCLKFYLDKYGVNTIKEVAALFTAENKTRHQKRKRKDNQYRKKMNKKLKEKRNMRKKLMLEQS